jgi:hypothetical protein
MDGLDLFPVWGVIIGDHGEEHPHRHLVVAPVQALSRNQPSNRRLKIWSTRNRHSGISEDGKRYLRNKQFR